MSRLNVLLLLVVVICALSVVNATNRQRELFISLGRAQMQERALQQDLAQLQYEQSSLSKTSRVEDTATSELKMETVTAGRTQYLTVAVASASASAAAAGDAPNMAAAASGQLASGAIAMDASAVDQSSVPSQAGDDTSNPATSSDLRAVISASSSAHAARAAASGALAASAPAKAASAPSKTTTASAKASNSAAAKAHAATTRHTKTPHTHGASQ